MTTITTLVPVYTDIEPDFPQWHGVGYQPASGSPSVRDAVLNSWASITGFGTSFLSHEPGATSLLDWEHQNWQGFLLGPGLTAKVVPVSADTLPMLSQFDGYEDADFFQEADSYSAVVGDEIQITLGIGIYPGDSFSNNPVHIPITADWLDFAHDATLNTSNEWVLTTSGLVSDVGTNPFQIFNATVNTTTTDFGITFGEPTPNTSGARIFVRVAEYNLITAGSGGDGGGGGGPPPPPPTRNPMVVPPYAPDRVALARERSHSVRFSRI